MGLVDDEEHDRLRELAEEALPYLERLAGRWAPDVPIADSEREMAADMWRRLKTSVEPLTDAQLDDTEHWAASLLADGRLVTQSAIDARVLAALVHEVREARADCLRLRAAIDIARSALRKAGE